MPSIPRESASAPVRSVLETAEPPKAGPSLLLPAALGGLAVLLAALFLWKRKRRPRAAEERTRMISGPSPAMNLGNLDDLPADLGPYTLQRVLGQGGFATTYSGVRKEDQRKVAVKVPHRHLLRDADAMSRFRQEAELGARLDHPSIVRVLDPGLAKGMPWIAMELAEGETLQDLLEREKRLPLKAAATFALDVAQALAHAHGKGIVHRDLKPANVMVHDGHAKVMDFGIARILDTAGLTATAIFLGTPAYASPESLSNSRVGPAADRYALGILLFEMLAGRPPFEADSPLAVLDLHRSTPPPDLHALAPGASQRLVRLVERLLAKAPDQRPEDPEVVNILQEVLEEMKP